MRRTNPVTGIALIALLLVPLSLISQSKQGLQGMWQGALSIQGIKLRIVFNLTPRSGGYQATMDSPDQGAKGIPTDTVVLRGDSIKIFMRMIGGQFSGELQPGDSVVHGTWSQSGAVFPLELVKTTIAVTYRRPQNPLPPLPYAEEEVAFDNRSAGFTIGGTLTKPNGPGRFPAAVLITGSGAQDRDETIFEHKPFRLIADQLTRNGIAVLRCDDRGVGKSGKSFQGATSADFATDVSAAVDYLRSRPDIRLDRIGLIGHSEGGLIAPMLAAQRTDIAFIVLLAGPSIPGAEILAQQDSLISLANGEAAESVVRRVQERRELFEIGRREPDTAKAREAMMTFQLERSRSNNPGGRADSLLVSEAQQLATRLNNAWMRFFLYHDPMEDLRKVRCPILAMNGEKDLQVPARSNLRGIERAGVEGKNSDVTVQLMPGLNHLFQTAVTGSPMEYATIEETMSPSALRLMTEWIVARTR